MIRNHLGLIAAAVCAIITVAAAGIVVHQRTEQVELVPVPGTKAGTPGVAWTLDAADVIGNEFAVFENPATYSGYGGSTAGFVDGGDVLVALAGLHNYRTEKFDKAQFVGVDAKTGSVRWKTLVPDLERCADRPTGGALVCVTMTEKPEIVSVNLDDGSLMKHPTAWQVIAIASTGGDVLTLEGNPEDADLRLHRGTPDNPSQAWTVPIDAEAAWEDSFGGVLTVSDNLALIQLGSSTIGIDVDTGKTAWKREYPDCGMRPQLWPGGIALRTRLDCLNQSALETEAISPTGHVVVSRRSALQPMLLTPPPGSPILLGDSAFDPESGRKLWSNKDLESTVAVIDDVALLENPGARSITGLDVHTGKNLWQTTIKQNTVMPTFTAAYGGCAMSMQTPYVTARDVHTGKDCWSIPLQSIIPTAGWDSTPAVEAIDSGFVVSTAGRFVGLRDD